MQEAEIVTEPTKEDVVKALPKHKFDEEKFDNTQSMEEKRDYIENLAKDIVVSMGFIGGAEEALIKMGVKSEALKIIIKSTAMLGKARKSLKKYYKKLK